MEAIQATKLDDRPHGALQHASKQLFNRDDDEMFQNWDQYIAFLRHRDNHTREIGLADRPEIFVSPQDTLELGTKDGSTYDMNELSFGQLCGKAKAPKQFVNELSPILAASVLNERLFSQYNNGTTVMNVLDTNGLATIRAFYTQKYSRMASATIAERIREVAEPMGYVPAGTLAGQRGGMPMMNDQASGLYAGQNDEFMFIANEKSGFDIDGETFYHLMCLWNSELALKTIGGLTSLYRFICGNHQIWGSRDSIEIKARHVGDGPQLVLDALCRVLEGYDKYRETNERMAKGRIAVAKNTEFADTRDRVQERLTKYLNKKRATEALPFLDDPTGHPQNPHSIYGVVQGVTRYSQTLQYAGARRDLDDVAGRIMADGVGF